MARCSHISGCDRQAVPGFRLCAAHWQAGEELRALDKLNRDLAAARRPKRARV